MNSIAMRIMDGVMSIPTILLAIALIALTNGSMQNVIIAITTASASLSRSGLMRVARAAPYCAPNTPPSV